MHLFRPVFAANPCLARGVVSHIGKLWCGDSSPPFKQCQPSAQKLDPCCFDCYSSSCMNRLLCTISSPLCCRRLKSYHCSGHAYVLQFIEQFVVLVQRMAKVLQSRNLHVIAMLVLFSWGVIWEVMAALMLIPAPSSLIQSRRVFQSLACLGIRDGLTFHN